MHTTNSKKGPGAEKVVLGERNILADPTLWSLCAKKTAMTGALGDQLDLHKSYFASRFDRKSRLIKVLFNKINTDGLLHCLLIFRHLLFAKLLLDDFKTKKMFRKSSKATIRKI